jgi:hypothetical protein
VIALANSPFGYPVGYPVWRHAAFIAINLTFGWLFLTRPRWLIWPCAILALQIFSGHGANAVRMWRDKAQIDWLSVAVIAIMLLALAVAARVSFRETFSALTASPLPE